jgi:hypothetical protein
VIREGFRGISKDIRHRVHLPWMRYVIEYIININNIDTY